MEQREGERNIALRLMYDGSAYHGWQVQKTEVTVAETLEIALGKICGHPVKVVGCGRTDAGCMPCAIVPISAPRAGFPLTACLWR